jgi:hypothetical protein
LLGAQVTLQLNKSAKSKHIFVKTIFKKVQTEPRKYFLGYALFETTASAFDWMIIFFRCQFLAFDWMTDINFALKEIAT